jgi:hypothetical protein
MCCKKVKGLMILNRLVGSKLRNFIYPFKNFDAISEILQPEHPFLQGFIEFFPPDIAPLSSKEGHF